MKLFTQFCFLLSLMVTWSAQAETISGSFHQDRYLAGFDTPFKTVGEFFLVPETGLAWVITSPFPSRLIMNEEGVTQIANDTITRSGSGGVGKIISEMIYPALANDWEKLSENFTVDLQKTDANWKATLLPKHPQLKEHIAELIVKGAKTTEMLVIRKAKGDYDKITFSNQHIWETTPPEALAAFEYEEHGKK